MFDQHGQLLFPEQLLLVQEEHFDMFGPAFNFLQLVTQLLLQQLILVSLEVLQSLVFLEDVDKIPQLIDKPWRTMFNQVIGGY